MTFVLSTRDNFQTKLASQASSSPVYSGPSMETNRLYVHNLHYGVRWYDLKDFMRTVGEVAHAKVLMSSTGRSQGCGIVVYATPEEAQRAIDTLNGQELKGRPIAIREDREPQRTAEQASAEGAGTSAKLPSEATSEAPSGGHLSTSSDASSDPQSGISSNAGGGAPSGGAPSSGAPSGGAGSSGASATEGVSVFVGNLPFGIAWQQLKQLFSTVGPVMRADIHMTPQRRSRGHGTVIFYDEETARRAIERFHNYKLEGRVIDVREDKPASERPAAFLWCTSFGEPSDVLFVSNLPWSTTDTDLVELFQSIAPLSRAQLQNFPDGRFTGCGVVRFESPASAELALAQLNGYNYGGRKLQVTFARYPPSSAT